MKQKYSKNTTVRDDISNQRDFVDTPEGHSGSFSEDNNIKITSVLLEELFHSATKQRKSRKIRKRTFISLAASVALLIGVFAMIDKPTDFQ